MNEEKWAWEIGQRFHSMEKKISDSEVDDVFRGAFDMHVHTAPSVRERPDIISLAYKAREMGLGGFVAKRAEFPTVADAEIANQVVAKIANSTTKIFGGIVLNNFVGGLNPLAVQEAVSHETCKVVWMPTSHGAYFLQMNGEKGGIEILTEKSDLKGEVREILEIVAKAEQKVCVASGHLSPTETLKLVEECTSRGIDVIATHVTQYGSRLSQNEMKDIIDRKGYLELCALTCIPGIYNPHSNIFEIPEIINTIGSNNIILSTDYGQPYSPNPIEGFRFFIKLLLTLGIDRKDIETMIKVNPQKLLGIQSSCCASMEAEQPSSEGK